MIKTALIEDLPQIISLWEKVSLNEFSEYIGDKNVEFFIKSGELEKECTKCLDKTYVFKNKEFIIGFIVIIENLVELKIIEPSFQNKGVGKQLYNFVIELIKEDYKTVRAECFAMNLRANTILEKSGFQFDGGVATIPFILCTMSLIML